MEGGDRGRREEDVDGERLLSMGSLWGYTGKKGHF